MKIKNIVRASGFRTLGIGALAASALNAASKATDVDIGAVMETAATAAVTSGVTHLGVILPAAFTITVAFIIYAIVKKGANKAKG